MEENEIPDTAKIWHYTNLPALISILQRKQLCFTRLSEQEKDPLEGRADPISDRRHWQLLEESIRLGWCHCWCIDEHESDLMWARSAKGLAVALQSTVGRLNGCFVKQYAESYVGNDKVKIVRGKVAYGKEPQPPNLPKYAFRKRIWFHGEQEYRVYISHEGDEDTEQSASKFDAWPAGCYPTFVDIDPMVLIEKGWVPPDCKDWEMKVVQNLLNDYGLSNIGVSRRPVEQVVAVSSGDRK